MRLTLLVPELIWPEPADQLTLGKLEATGLAWLLARAAFGRQPRIPFEAALAGQFNLESSAYGALRLLGESNGEGALEGDWLCADPVHLRFHQERIILADAGAFELDEDEAQLIVGALNTEFADIGQFHIATARRWYFRPNTLPDGHALQGAGSHATQPISAVAGRRVDSEISDKNAALTRWLNEIQMFLHSHPVNERRQAEGKPAVNSLWLWGGGRLPHPLPGHFTGAWSDNALATGLARASGLPVHPLPTGLADILKLASPGTRQLAVLDNLLPPVLYEDSEGWRAALQTLETSWFAPLRAALGHQIETLTIVAPTIYGELTWTLHGKDRWKFWRKSRPLAAIAAELAEGKS